MKKKNLLWCFFSFFLFKAILSVWVRLVRVFVRRGGREFFPPCVGKKKKRIIPKFLPEKRFPLKLFPTPIDFMYSDRGSGNSTRWDYQNRNLSRCQEVIVNRRRGFIKRRNEVIVQRGISAALVVQPLESSHEIVPFRDPLCLNVTSVICVSLCLVLSEPGPYQIPRDHIFSCPGGSVGEGPYLCLPLWYFLHFDDAPRLKPASRDAGGKRRRRRRHPRDSFIDIYGVWNNKVKIKKASPCRSSVQI